MGSPRGYSSVSAALTPPCPGPGRSRGGCRREFNQLLTRTTFDQLLEALGAYSESTTSSAVDVYGNATIVTEICSIDEDSSQAVAVFNNGTLPEADQPAQIEAPQEITYWQKSRPMAAHRPHIVTLPTAPILRLTAKDRETLGLSQPFVFQRQEPPDIRHQRAPKQRFRCSMRRKRLS